MNNIVEREMPNMKNFLHQIVSCGNLENRKVAQKYKICNSLQILV